MILTIWRHGQAGDAARDFDCELTPLGREDISFGCAQFRQICLRKALPLPDSIVHSPWVRTSQTAAIIAAAFPEAALSNSDSIGSGVDTRDASTLLHDVLRSKSPPQHLLLVSHQPLVSRFIDELLDDYGRVPGLSPGGLATLSTTIVGRGCAQLQFWALPKGYEAAQ